MARTAKYGRELLSERVMLTLTPSQFADLKSRVGKGDLSHYMRERILGVADPNEIKHIEESNEVPLLGYIHAGDAMTITHLSEGLTATPPIPLNSDCYALVVVGDSMTRDYGLSIPDGSTAFFCPQAVVHFGAIVHVEWPRNDGEHECTLKKYCPNPDGTIAFEPFNKKHKPITKKQGEFVIRGVFIQSQKDGEKQH